MSLLSGKFERLPSNVKPVLYELSLKPDLQTFKFSGQETISVEIGQGVSKIILNSIELNITNVRLSLNDQVLIPEIHLLNEEETLVLQFSNEVPAGKAKLFIEFNGELNDKMRGFYRGKYLKNAEKEDEYYAATQFEASDSRRCFPCWDEPAIKARFDITVDVDSNKMVLSNMPIVEETHIENGCKRIKFARTPIMSTYLLAVVVGDFEFLEDTSGDDVLVRVYTPPGKKEQGKFALDIATKALLYYKEYFHLAYPLPKLDLIALSEQSFGAMENWGLVTYSEQYLLVDEANTSALTKQDVALTVGHELAHMWFGNLVTMEWWTHLWLNEGYASFAEYLCVDHIFPDYDIWTQFATDAYFRALKLDVLSSSHPIEVPVGRPSEVHEIFDEISYKKGASVIRMLCRYIGETDFRNGMKLYLTRHQYGNAFTEDLWAALEEVSRKPVKAVMCTWTKQTGFPLVYVKDSIQEDNSRVLVLSQSRFCSEGAENNGESSWLIPISFCTQSTPNKECFSTIMETRECKIVVPNVAAQDWIKLNQGTIGFYRVKYQSSHLLQLVPSIEDKTLPPLDRLGILDDLLALVQIGQATTSQVLNLIWSMRKEDNYTVWDTIVNCLEKIRTLLIDMDFVDQFNRYGIQVMKLIYEQLGYESKPKESHLTSLHRNLVLNQMIKFGATDFTDTMRKKFKQHCLGIDTLPANQRSIVYRTVLASDGKNALNELMELYKKTNTEEEKNRILMAFTAVGDVGLIDEILKLTQCDIFTKNGVITAMISLAYSKVGRVKTFNFLKDHYDELHDKYASSFSFGRFIKCTLENFSSEEQAKEIENFFATKNTSFAERAIQQSLESIRNNATWLKRDGDLIKSYLTDLKL